MLELVHQDVGVGGRHDQAIGRDVAAVDPAFRRRVRAPQAADQLHLGLGAHDHRHRPHLVRGLAERGGPFVQIGALRRAPRSEDERQEAHEEGARRFHTLSWGNLDATGRGTT